MTGEQNYGPTAIRLITYVYRLTANTAHLFLEPQQCEYQRYIYSDVRGLPSKNTPNGALWPTCSQQPPKPIVMCTIIEDNTTLFQIEDEHFGGGSGSCPNRRQVQKKYRLDKSCARLSSHSRRSPQHHSKAPPTCLHHAPSQLTAPAPAPGTSNLSPPRAQPAHSTSTGTRHPAPSTSNLSPPRAQPAAHSTSTSNLSRKRARATHGI